MTTRVQFKYNDRGKVVEMLTTAVFGLVFVSKITYEYDEEGTLTAEITWQDTKTIRTIKRFSPILA